MVVEKLGESVREEEGDLRRGVLMCLCGMCMRRVVPKVKVSLPIYPHVGSIPYLAYIPYLSYLPDLSSLLTIHSSIQSYLMRFSKQKRKSQPPSLP